MVATLLIVQFSNRLPEVFSIAKELLLYILKAWSPLDFFEFCTFPSQPAY